MKSDDILPLLQIVHPILSHEETTRLILAAQKGDAKARDRVIRHNIRFIHSAVNVYTTAIPKADLMQQGMMGLNRAIDGFNPHKGTKFLTYAAWQIKAYVSRYLSINMMMIRLPTNKILEYNRAKKADERGKATEEQLECLHSVASNRTVSIDAQMPNEDGYSFGDMLADQSPLPDAAIAERHVKRQAARSLAMCSPRNREILELHFGINQAHAWNLQEIGDRIGMTREGVRQVVASELRRMRGTDRMQGLVMRVRVRVAG